jgi:hypothetical protein
MCHTFPLTFHLTPQKPMFVLALKIPTLFRRKAEKRLRNAEVMNQDSHVIISREMFPEAQRNDMGSQQSDEVIALFSTLLVNGITQFSDKMKGMKKSKEKRIVKECFSLLEDILITSFPSHLHSRIEDSLFDFEFPSSSFPSSSSSSSSTTSFFNSSASSLFSPVDSSELVVDVKKKLRSERMRKGSHLGVSECLAMCMYDLESPLYSLTSGAKEYLSI